MRTFRDFLKNKMNEDVGTPQQTIASLANAVGLQPTANVNQIANNLSLKAPQVVKSIFTNPKLMQQYMANQSKMPVTPGTPGQPGTVGPAGVTGGGFGS